LELYIKDNHIVNFIINDHSYSLNLDYDKNTAKLTYFDILTLFYDEGIIIDNIKYYTHDFSFKNIYITSRSYKKLFSLTKEVLDVHPNVFINNRNLFSEKNLNCWFNNIKFNTEKDAVAFLMFLKSKGIKKYRFFSRAYIGDDEYKFDEIFNDFLIKNKFQKYNISTDKLEIENIIWEKSIKYLLSVKNIDYKKYTSYFSIEFLDKNTDKQYGSNVLVYLKLDLYKNQLLYKIQLYWKFYKSGYIVLEDEEIKEI